MAILPIRKYPDPVLKQPAAPVEEIKGDIQKLIDDMIETMYQAPGIGLAANQVGALHRVIVFDVSPPEERPKPVVIVNPKITYAEGEQIYTEACLSVGDFSSEVRRKALVTVEGMDRQGQPLEVRGEGLLAVVLQHEIDHLDGRLFIDRISRLKRSLYIRQVRKQLQK
ncbi:MAG: peptide deformylase [Deltaproteobacteria bacterium]|nr:peptide deformylase [Deltaproteobacteria bacterium]MBW1953556.1 peptide deformylase [Deltaproteobacteria bacterium]MBW1987716.1 peptide deformylase [Deltaproteobacteria bacterium]